MTQPNPGSTEPLLSVGMVSAAVVAVIGLLTAFAVPVTEEQKLAIVGVIGAAGPLVTALWGRLKVYAPATVARLLAAARAGK